jgi:hypothetical protein
MGRNGVAVANLFSYKLPDCNQIEHMFVFFFSVAGGSGMQITKTAVALQLQRGTVEMVGCRALVS